MKLFFFDTETTGLKGDDQILQFGGIYGFFDGEIFHEEHRINQYINVTKDISDKAEKTHGINKRMIKHFGYIENYIDEFLGYINKSDYIIGHNIDFDIRMLQQESIRIGKNFDWNSIKSFCTMKKSVNILNLPGNKRPKLLELHRHLFGESFDDAHNAMADIEATKKCFLELVKTGKTEIWYKKIGESSNIETVHIEDKDENSWSLLDTAIYERDIEQVKYLIEKGVDIENKSKNGNTPLMMALFYVGWIKGRLKEVADEQHEDYGRQILLEAEKIVELLIEKGADVNAKDSDGYPVLIKNIYGGEDLEILNLLIEQGADIETTDKYGHTPLVIAIQELRIEAIKFLIKKGVNINMRDDRGDTPLMYTRSFEIASLLIKNGADINNKNKAGKTFLMYISGCSNDNPLKSEFMKIIKLLLKNGVDINTKDRSGKTALSWANKNHIKNDKIIKLLIDNGARK